MTHSSNINGADMLTTIYNYTYPLVKHVIFLHFHFYLFSDSYGARYNVQMSLPQQNPKWASANLALRDLYDSQETMTMRLTKKSKLCMPAVPEGTPLLT